MQITPLVISNSLLQNIQNQESQITQLQQEESTGQKFQVPSDNPIAAETTLGLNNTLAQIQDYSASAQAAEGALNTTNGALSSMISLWDQALQTATQASNSTNNQADLNSLAQTVTQMQANVGEILNTQYEGNYIFSGYQTQTAPVTVTSGQYPSALSSWPTSTADAQNYTIDNNISVTANLTGWETVAAPAPSSGSTTPTPVNYLEQAYNDLGSLVSAIQQGPASVQKLLPQLQSDLSNLVSAQSLVGGRLSRVQNTLTQLGNAQTNLTQSVANVSGANMAQVTTQLAQEEDAYQAALQSGSKILSLSLLNYINP